jgi:hypothetical protein
MAQPIRGMRSAPESPQRSCGGYESDRLCDHSVCEGQRFLHNLTIEKSSPVSNRLQEIPADFSAKFYLQIVLPRSQSSTRPWIRTQMNRISAAQPLAATKGLTTGHLRDFETTDEHRWTQMHRGERGRSPRPSHDFPFFFRKSRDRQIWRRRISPRGSEHLRSSVFICGFKHLFGARDGEIEASARKSPQDAKKCQVGSTDEHG